MTSENTMISVEKLSKRYRLGGRHYNTLRDRIAGMFRSHADDARDLWALTDLSFDIPAGQTVGLVGRNGAGKSTLLKILARVTTPTAGHATIDGRVGSLLDVGTGFHPELTGRENVYLSGAILGMRRRDVARRFDEIVAFAGVERFLDEPVKHYSAGMYVRLAFAVGVHLDTEVLFVDEVLAVGDAEFQQRAFARVRTLPRTIVFVSHNLGALRQTCTRGLWIDGGRLRADGPIDQVIDSYLASQVAPATAGLETAAFSVDELALAGAAVSGGDLELKLHARAKKPIAEPGLWAVLTSSDGNRLGAIDLRDLPGAAPPPLEAGQSLSVSLVFEALPLTPGRYQIEVRLGDGDVEEPLPPLAVDIGGAADYRGPLALRARAVVTAASR
jgi:ABC-type polysaccharide/polyol phosphate transport system ATPase subunit